MADLSGRWLEIYPTLHNKNGLLVREARFEIPLAKNQPSTSSIASMSSWIVASVSLPMLEMRKVVPLIFP